MEVDHSFIQWFINNRVADSFVNPVYCYVKVPSPSLLTFWQGGPRQAGSWGNRRPADSSISQACQARTRFFFTRQLFNRTNLSHIPGKKATSSGLACLPVYCLFVKLFPRQARNRKNVQTKRSDTVSHILKRITTDHIPIILRSKCATDVANKSAAQSTNRLALPATSRSSRANLWATQSAKSCQLRSVAPGA
jgi:hypothetical protein